MRSYYHPGIFIVGLFLLSAASVFGQTPRHENTFSIDSIANRLESERGVNIYYQAGWFGKKSFHNSILTLPVDEIVSVLRNTCNCLSIKVDSSSIVFVPKDSSDTNIRTNTKNGQIAVGNPREYGKYSKAVLNGKIIDGMTGNPVGNVRVSLAKIKTSAATDKNGDFSIKLPVGDYDARITGMGYEDTQFKMKVFGNGSATFQIFESSIALGEVVVNAERSDKNIVSTQMSVVKLNSKDIKELPLVFGETDVIKSVTLLPGVQTIGEFGTGFNVRGGGADQNLILVEGVPIFNSSHLFGLTSILNPDGISDVTLFKAGIPAKYGERVSSLMDIRMGTPNSEKIKAKGGIGLINSRLTLDAPLFNNKVNLLIGGRSTYSNWLLHEIPDIDLMNSSAQFYDLNALLTISPSVKDKVIAFGYFSKDNFAFSNNTKYAYDNTLASIRWTHTINQKFTTSLMAGLSRYTYKISELDTTRRNESYSLNSDLLYNNAKWNLAWHPNNSHTIDIGANAVFYAIKPGNLAPYDSTSLVIPIEVQKSKASEFAIYASDDIAFSPKFGVELGARFNAYTLKGPGSFNVYNQGSPINLSNAIDTITYGNDGVIKRYYNLEPRISFRYSIDDYSSMKLSYNRINQNINLVSNSAVMTPADSWKLSDSYIKPLKCDQVAIGYFRNFNQNTIETSIELYYKRLQDIIEYKNGAQLLLNKHLETDVLNAQGSNYGIELFVKKNSGRLTGWLSYTFSRSMRKTNGIAAEDQVNNNQYFPSSYDKPNNIVLNANYHITRRWRFSGSFLYNTGRPVTLPEVKYSLGGYQLIYYSERNKYRLPDYHRLDVSLTLDESLRLKKKWKGSWTFSIINLYGRKNAYSVYYRKETPSESNNFRSYSLYKLYIIGIPLPTITYNFSF